MAKPRDVGNAGSDLTANLEQDLNDFIRATILELSSEDNPISPIDTGFLLQVGQLVHKDPDQINQEKNLLRGVN